MLSKSSRGARGLGDRAVEETMTYVKIVEEA
jgi:hypothetical protein